MKEDIQEKNKDYEALKKLSLINAMIKKAKKEKKTQKVEPTNKNRAY